MKVQTLEQLNSIIVKCVKCPRLVRHRRQVAEDPPRRYRGQRYWGRPLPGFGDRAALIYIVGLAPAAHGGNRTGRIFTGDRSGEWLYRALYNNRLSSSPISESANDGLQLHRTYIGAAVRCAPPENKPTLEEFENCRPYLHQEMQLLADHRVIVALGSIAYNSVKKTLRELYGWKIFRFPPFGHGTEAVLPDQRIVLCSYHPSQQNTFTGKLTGEMLDEIFRRARRMAGLNHGGHGGKEEIKKERVRG